MDSENIQAEPFVIKDCALIAIATGKRAQNLRELKEYIIQIDPDSIYYHFWGSLLRPRFDDPEYHNDFAIWCGNSLHDKVLAERLAAIDPKDYNTIEELRVELIEIIEERLDELEYYPWSNRDSQFEFIRSQIVVFDTHRTITQPSEFTEIIRGMSVGSIFFHFIDARRRNEDSIDDFQNWLRNFGDEYGSLMDSFRQIDPYFSPLTQLRTELTDICKSFFRKGR